MAGASTSYSWSMLQRMGFGKYAGVLKASLTSGGVMTVGDCIYQSFEQAQGVTTTHDWQRTARFAIVGATLHGPFFHQGFKLIDRIFGTTMGNPVVAIKKSAFGHTFLFPTYLCAFSGYMGLLEGKTPSESVQKIRHTFWPMCVGGTLFWPAANVVNFTYIPPANRMLYINCMGVLWNSFLSYSNAKYGSAATEYTAAEVD